MPADSVKISDERYDQVIANPLMGKVRGHDSEGLPILLDPPTPPAETEATKRSELQALNQLAANQKSALSNRIGVINDNIEFGEETEDELAELPLRSAQLVAWKKYAGALGKVTTQVGWFEDTQWPKQPEEGMDLEISPVGRT